MDLPNVWFAGQLPRPPLPLLATPASQREKKRPAAKPNASLPGQAANPQKTTRRELPPPNPRQKMLVYAAGFVLAAWLLFLLTMAFNQ